MTDWSGALVRAFQRHLDEERFDTGSGGSTGSRAQSPAVCRTANTGTSTKVAVVPVIPEPVSGTETADETAGVGTTGTTGTTRTMPATAFDQAHRDNIEERAAIVEYDACIPRVWAEGFARLQHSDRPKGMDAKGWEQLIEDSGLFLDRWGKEAHQLGWSAADLFGVRVDESGTRCKRAGLAMLIRGGEVVSIGRDHATIRLPHGPTLIYLRRTRSGAVAVWDLIDRVPADSGQAERTNR